MGGLTLTDLLANAVALLLGFAVHEASHAWIAYRLGDDTAKQHGRLTLNPLAHLDPIGAFTALVLRIGWAKPVPVNPYRLRYGPRVGGALVAAAGPLSNLIIAILAAVPLRLGYLNGAPLFLQKVVWTLVVLNVGLFVFNLIPLAPLDGISVLGGIVGSQGNQALAPLRDYGSQILLGLILLGFVLPRLNILSLVLSPIILGLTRLLIGQA